MNKIKIKNLLKLAEKLKDIDPATARQLKVLAEGALTLNHKPRFFKVSGVFKDAIETVKERLADIPYALIGGLAVRQATLGF